MLKEYIPKIGDVVSYEGTSRVKGTTETVDGIVVELETDCYIERININYKKCVLLTEKELRV